MADRLEHGEAAEKFKRRKAALVKQIIRRYMPKKRFSSISHRQW